MEDQTSLLVIQRYIGYDMGRDNNYLIFFNGVNWESEVDEMDEGGNIITF